MRYDGSWIMYPPRASVSIRPEEINNHVGKSDSFIAQPKFNGERTMIVIRPGGSVDDTEFYNRHREHSSCEAIHLTSVQCSIDRLNLDKTKYHILDGEFMHRKTSGLKRTFIMYDILVHNSEYLVGETYAQRYCRLVGISKNAEPSAHESPEYEQATGREIALFVKPCLWLADIAKPTTEAYERFIDMPEVEGLVIKDLRGKLKIGTSADNNIGWQVRCRKPHPNYTY